MDIHFQSFEKSTEEKVRNEFHARRFQTLKNMVIDDRITLDASIKSIQEALSEGGNIYKSCLKLSKFTQDIERKIKEHEDQLDQLSQSFDLLLVSLSGHEAQVVSLLEKIRSLNRENVKIVDKVCELKSLITPKMDIILSGLKDAQAAMNFSEPYDLKSVEALPYFLSGLITIMESLNKSWDSHLNSLNNYYADIFKFLCIKGLCVHSIFDFG